jgi:hypothetical protein
MRVLLIRRKRRRRRLRHCWKWHLPRRHDGGAVGGGSALAFFVTAAALATLGLVALLVLALHDQRLLGLGLVTLDDEVAQHGVVETEAFGQFVQD